MTRKQRRLAFITAGLISLSLAVVLILMAVRDSLVYFYTPSEIIHKNVGVNHRLRIGGLVKEGSVSKNGIDIEFVVTDLEETLTVKYRGVLPDLFREGQGVVTEGRLNQNGEFIANEVLAKHDEKYMPKEVADALKKSDRWRGEGQKS